MDIFGRFARSPDCLVAIDAADGGTWRSPFRPGVVYPSAVPRNFAAEPATWYEFDKAQKTIGTDDIEFEMEFYWNYDGAPATNVPFFALTAANNAIYIYAYAGGSLNIMTNLIGPPYAILGLRAPGNPLSRGYHKIVARVIGNVFWAQLDSESAMTSSYPRQTGQSFSAQVSSFNGNISFAQLRNLTTNTVLWAYPNFEEQTRLITKLNVWTGNGCFEQASSSARWAVSTPLSLTGMDASFTFVCRCKFVTAASGFQVAFGDGSPLSGNVSTQGTALTYEVTNNRIDFYVCFRKDGANVFATSRVAATGYIDRFVVWSCRVDGATGDLRLFADGVDVGTTVYQTNITGTLGTYISLLRIGHPTATAVATALNQVKNLLVFDRTLSIGEIQLLR